MPLQTLGQALAPSSTLPRRGRTCPLGSLRWPERRVGQSDGDGFPLLGRRLESHCKMATEEMPPLIDKHLPTLLRSFDLLLEDDVAKTNLQPLLCDIPQSHNRFLL